MADPTASPYLESLHATRDHLAASIAARESRKAGQSDDYNDVTERERARLAEVTAEIARLSPPAPTPAPQP